MPIINTNTFWNYVINESEAVIDNVKKALTRVDWDFTEKKYVKSIYYQVINEIEVDLDVYTTLRFPAGLTNWLAEKAMIQIENKPRDFGRITKDDIYKKANEIKQINENYEVRDYQVDAVYNCLNRFGSLIQSTTGSGKGQPLSLEIPTPHGVKTIGSLKIGDLLFGSDGRPTKILGVFPQGVKKVYKFKFSSGRETYCDESHLWTFKTKDGKILDPISTSKLLEIPLYEQIKEKRKHKFFCLKQPVVEYTEKKFDVPPYHTGFRLGEDIRNVDKSIPPQYLKGSIEQRLDLLRGLMDSKGKYGKSKSYDYVTFDTMNKKLSEDIKQLVFSLGGFCHIKQMNSKRKYPLYSMIIRTEICPFHSKKNPKDWRCGKMVDYLESIEYVREEETLCVKVSNEDELYLTSDYVITHNTSILCLLVELLKDKKVLITNGNNFILQQIYDRLVSFGETDISWNGAEDPDYSKRIIIINTSSSDVRLNEHNEKYINFLKTVQLWCIDEAAHFQSLTNFEPMFYMDQEVIEHVVGYTATPFRDYESPYSNQLDFTLIALLGEPAFRYEMVDTIADKNIAQPYSYFIRYKNIPSKLPKELRDNYFMQYRANITYNKNRNAAGFAMAKFLNDYNIKTLLSFNNIKPGQSLLKKLAENGVKALFICGGETIYEYVQNKRKTFKLEKRKGNVDDVKAALKNGYNIICASQVFDEGVDIEIFQAAVLFSAGKSPIKILQVSGRASRKKEVNNVSFIIDFRDVGGHYIFERQYNERKHLLEISGVKNIDDVYKFMDMIKQIGHKDNDKVDM